MFPYSLPTLCLLCSLAVSAAALSPSVPYQRGPLPWRPGADLYFSVDLQARTAALAVLVNDSVLVTSTPGPTWIGLGISESTSGGMLGADIVTAEFARGQVDKCVFTDRHVPFVAYPLWEQPSVFPDPDDCQHDGSWTLVRCERDLVTGHIILEVVRSLDAHDTQDRDIVEGPNAVIFAYGTSFRYHGENRASQRVVFYQNATVPEQAIALPDLPDDVDGFVDILATDYVVPSNLTTVYACTSAQFPLEGNDSRMIVAVDVILNSTNDMVHHLVLYLCSGNSYATQVNKTLLCDTGDDAISGPLGNPAAICSTFVSGYAKGTKRLVLPKEAGIPVTRDSRFLILQTHYDNPSGIQSNVDASGTRVYYTDTLREHEAGSLVLGDAFVSRKGIVQSAFEYEHTCPSECTKKFSRSINIYSSLLHMHTTGKETYTNRFSENGTYLENMHKVNFWSDRFQIFKTFTKPLVMEPGDQLQSTCLYDTSKRPKTEWNLATTDEMCMNFVGYWPVQKDPVSNDDINICAFLEGATICGDGGKIRESTILPVPNPKFNDTVGAPTLFGDGVENCDAEVPMPTVSSIPGTTSSPTEIPSALEASPPAPSAEAMQEPASETNESIMESTPELGTVSSSSSDDDNVCFPETATVRLRDGSEKRMGMVAIGDEVQVGPGLFSPVFMFTHKSRGVRYSFVKITTVGGNTLSLTAGHFLYVNDHLMMADMARVGNFVTLVSGERSEISEVSVVSGRGLYNPQTIQGDIVVDGVLASTYTRAVRPLTAHGLLAAVRWLYAAVGMDFSILVCASAS